MSEKPVMSGKPAMSAQPGVSVQTAEGRGAVAVVQVTGPGAVDAVDACFLAASGRPLAQQPPGAIRFGRWRDASGEEVVVVRRGSPDPAVEVHCHGGAAAVRAVVRDLVAQGCVQQPARPEHAPPGAAAVTLDAQLALRHALTERAAGVLLDQADGALERALREIADSLSAGGGVDQLRQLLDRAELGQRLTSPWRVVLAGAPNVGKSSLINALLGYSRAIVFDQPGTTRDVLTAAAAVEGWPVSLSDTAGLRAADDPTEAAGVELARQMLQQADLILDIRDAAQPDAPSAIPADAPATRRLVVWNKQDLAPAPAGSLSTSAATGQGVDDLLAAIARSLVPHPPEPGAALPVTAAHAEQLARTLAAAQRGDDAAALQAVQALLAPAGSD